MVKSLTGRMDTSGVDSFYGLFVSLIVVLFMCPSVRAMTCPPCERIHCSPKSASKLDCKGGVTTGVCGCCPQCAKIEGEKCGGFYNSLGKCDKGLYCEMNVKTKRKRHQGGREPEGLCKLGKPCSVDHV